MKLKIVNAEAFQLEAEGVRLQLTPPRPVRVEKEEYPSLLKYNPDGWGWANGTHLKATTAMEGAQTDAFLPGSETVETEDGIMKRGEDYDIETRWGAIGRLDNGRIGENTTVRISYTYFPSRIDSIIRFDGRIEVVPGEPGAANPVIPVLPPGAERLANVLFRCGNRELTSDMLFPITETEFPKELFPENPPLRTLEKIRKGEPVRILAWGDSVTACAYMDFSHSWQNCFLRSLKERYPQARIEWITEGWGGRTMTAFFNEPAGSLHNFEEKVLAPRPDLVISEFVNDEGLSRSEWEKNFPKALADFRRIGAEWIILTPHYVRTDWMNFSAPRDCDEDPRPYVKFLREFAARERIPLADASLIWGRLYRRGIPYDTLLVNAINHPNPEGMTFFRDALMPLFP